MTTIKTAILAGLALVAGAVQASRFEVTGTVLQVRSERQSVVVAHEDIPGFMPAMTMPFQVREPAELEGLAKGDRVRFEFVVEDSGSYAEAFSVVGKERVTAAASAPREAVRKVREGDPAPTAQLVNQDGNAIGLVAEDGRWTVLTFIFTRCPVPEFCPLMNRNFLAIQEKLEGEAAASARFLSITLDPAFDTPERLKQYGEAYGADFDRWEFATGSTEEIDRLTDAFRVYVKENGVTLDHTLCTALVSPEGEVRKIWRGNFWKPEEVAAELREVAAIGEAVASRSE